eukprot:XP_019074377.1 PREDICTED: SNF1-related protein kinase regulatory subunit gamma-1-like [Vitis vinifera]
MVFTARGGSWGKTGKCNSIAEEKDGFGASGGGGIAEKKDALISKPTNQLDSGTALQVFLDHIPISSIPGLQNSLSVLELKTGDSVRDAIHFLYEKNVLGAPIADVLESSDDSNAISRRFSDQYVGFIDFASMVLWSLEESEKAEGDGNYNIGNNGIFSMLDQNPHIGQTKIGVLAKSFLWDPFFPITLDDSLMHVLLLLSTHRLQILPVMEQPNSKVIGFVTQNAVIQLLLQSSGLEWFDNLADKALSEFRYSNSLSFRFAILNRENKRLIGSLRSSDIHLLLDNDDLFHGRKTRTIEEFIHLDARKSHADASIEGDLGALVSAGILRLRNSVLPRMDWPVTNRKTDTLKQAMKNLAETRSNFSFLVDELQHLTGVLTVRDMITQFAPPCVDSRFTGGGFFESALEQSGCQVKNGTLVCDH